MFKKIRNVYDVVSGYCLILCIVCIVIQIVARYVLSISMPWTEEMARYFLVAVTFLGSACASAKGEHLGAFFLRDMAGGRLKAVLYLINNVGCLLFELFLIVGSYQMYFVTLGNPAVTIPWVQLNWLYIVMGFGAAMMTLCTLIDIHHSALLIKSGDTDRLPAGLSSPFFLEERE